MNQHHQKVWKLPEKMAQNKGTFFGAILEILTEKRRIIVVTMVEHAVKQNHTKTYVFCAYCASRAQIHPSEGF